MSILTAPDFVDAELTARHFGGNILASRDELNGDSGFESLVEELGVTSLRYPGGTLTEQYFDITRPDAELVYDEDGTSRSFIALSDFMRYAADNDLSAVIVLPTRTNLSDIRDANGNRYAEIDENALRDFIHDTVSGLHGEAKIDAFEIGNEYWGSGQMSSIEYGRVASEMSRIVNDELTQMAAENPGLVNSLDAIDIIVQSGSNFDYGSLTHDYGSLGSAQDIVEQLSSDTGVAFGKEVIYQSGELNWTEIANRLILNEFDTPEELNAVDGVVTHLYSKGSVIPDQRSFQLEIVNETWGAAIKDFESYVTEWNQSGVSNLFDRETDYGLFQAHEMLETLEEMVRLGADQAQVWPLLQNTANALSKGFTHDELTAPGKMFAMMSESLTGKQMLDFQPDTTATEFLGDSVDVHGFYGAEEITFFIASTSDEVAVESIDLSAMLIDIHAATVRVLGVADGEDPGNTASQAVVDEIPLDEVFRDGALNVVLGRGEIMQIVISDFVPTEAFDILMDEIDDSLAEADSAAESLLADDIEIYVGDFSEFATTEEEPAPTEVEDETSRGVAAAGLGDLGIMFLLPLLTLFGVA